MSVAQQFQQAEECFFQGKYQEAANLCQGIIHSQPDFARAYYLLGALFKMTGNLERAVEFSDMAISRDSNNAQFYLQKGHSLLALGKTDEAVGALKQTLALDKNMALACVLLANIAMKKRNFTEAESYLADASAISKSPEIEEHLGLCAQLQGNFAKAEGHFRAMLALDEKQAGGYLHLARLLASQKRIQEAEPLFRRVIELNPAATEALLALTHLAQQRGAFKEAIILANKALQVNASLIAAYIMLGSLLILTGQHAAAQPVYEEGLKREPQNPFLIEGYAKVLMQLGKLSEAKPFIEKVLERNPDDKNMQYLYAVISGKTLDTAPPEYVAGLFDEYADRFEEHLTKGLRYHTPDEISAAIRAVLAQRGQMQKKLSLLDLGCGTGLGAEALKDITDFRVGVDLSSKMIEKSNEKHLYSETAVQDITQYMNETAHRFDMVICVDTLVYIGKLEPFFDASCRVLNPGGLLAVSVEQGDDDEPFTLRSSARYGHAKGYLESCAKKSGFTTHTISLVDLRKDKQGIIKGYIAVFEKE